MKVVTSGAPYIDIDAYASCIAYAQLLKLKVEKAIAVSSAVLNESIPPTLRALSDKLSTTYTPTNSDAFIVLDVSDPDHFDNIVDHNRIEEIIDHHAGFEDYWKKFPSINTRIEHIGAIATIIFEMFEQEGLEDKILKETAQLLIAAIVDNTLNFQAHVTTERDKKAFEKLSKIAQISSNWVQDYFQECQRNIEQNIQQAIGNDTKILTFESTGTIAIAQLTLWNGQELIENYRNNIVEELSSMGQSWMLNVLSMRDGKSYFLVSDEKLATVLAQSLDISFKGLVGQTDRMWLRKEIIAHLDSSFHSE